MLHAIQLLAAALLPGVFPIQAGEDTKPAQKPFDDAAFVMKAASGGMFEVELGKVAGMRAKNDDVKAFGQLMIDDHSKANEALRKAAKAAGLAVPEKMGDEDQKEFERFKNYKGESFDRDYVKCMIEDHEKDVAEFKRASKEAKNPMIKDFATKTLPVIEGHLEKAKKLQPRD